MLDGVPVAAVSYAGFKGVIIRNGDVDSYYMFDLEADPGLQHAIFNAAFVALEFL